MPARTRAARFKAFRDAAAAHGISKSQWCRDRNISRTHLDRVLDDPSQSAPLTREIDAFIKEAAKLPKPARVA